VFYLSGSQAEYQVDRLLIFKVFGMTRLRIEPQSPVLQVSTIIKNKLE